MARSTYPNGSAPLRITHKWDWNPIRWSWWTYSIPVKTLISDDETVREVLGTVVQKQRGPFHSTVVTVP